MHHLLVSIQQIWTKFHLSILKMWMSFRFLFKISLLMVSFHCAQPNDYLNAILVPAGGQIPLDVENLASQGIFQVVRISVPLTVVLDLNLS
jgi:hypothetical protein